MQLYRSNINPQNSVGVVIGISEWPYSESLTTLPTAHNSSKRINEILIDNELTDFLPQKVHLLTNQGRNEILVSLQKLCSDCTDTLFVYYCGHGLLSEDSNLILTANDTTFSTKDITGIHWKDFRARIENCSADKKVVILDCCYSGIAAKFMGENELESKKLKINGSYLITAVKDNKKAAADHDKKYTRFSGNIISVLSEGVKGRDFLLTIDDIFSEVKSRCDFIDINKSPDKATSGDNIGSLRLIYNQSYRSQFGFIDEKDCQNTTRKLIFERIKNNFKHSGTSQVPSVLLVKTAISYPIKRQDFGLPLGLWSMKSYLKNYGYQVDILDERLDIVRGTKNNDIERIFARYDVIGFSVCTCEVPQAMAYANIAKKLKKTTVFGGIFTKSNERYLLNHKQVDYVIPAVATWPFFMLLETLRKRGENERIASQIKGVYTKDNVDGEDDSVNYWEAESLPSIDDEVYDIILKHYKDHCGNKIDLVTGRGCGYICDFCSISRETRRRTFRETGDVINEIERHFNAGFKIISIKDENFVDSIRRLLIILGTCKNRNIDVEYKIKSRIDNLKENKKEKEPLLKILKDNNVKEIQFGVETIDQFLLGKVHKGYSYTSEEIKAFFETVMEHGICVNASFVIGLPDEQVHYHEKLIRFIEEFENYDMFKVYLNFYTPHPFKNSFKLSSNVGLSSNDLSLFTHKNPIVIPSDWRRSDKKSLIDCYNEIVKISRSSLYNPPIDDSHVNKYINGRRLDEQTLPFYG